MPPRKVDLTPADEARAYALRLELDLLAAILEPDNLATLRQRKGEVCDELKTLGASRGELAAQAGVEQKAVDWARKAARQRASVAGPANVEPIYTVLREVGAVLRAESAFTRQKAALTRAINSKNPDKALTH